MKKSPASIERNATASAEQSTSERAHAAEIVFHSKPPAKQTKKEKTMKAKEKIAIAAANRILDLDLQIDAHSYIDFLCDGAALAEAGYDDVDQTRIEEATAILREAV